MHDRFDQEFYRSRWQRVLPIGPHGIQPYIHIGPSAGVSAPPTLHRLLAMLAGLARGVIAFRRRSAVGMAKRPMRPATGPRAERQRPPVRYAPEVARRPMREAKPSPLSRAA